MPKELRKNLTNSQPSQQGFLLAFGEMFLKSDGVFKILKRREMRF